ncbi:MAG: type II secretion system F family protein [Pirellulales bacterium]|nr:type II secretion system F family protein [Pirellulales bacterium]
MAMYRYTAINQEGHRVDGHAEAASVDMARTQLEQDGLEVLEIMQVDPVSSNEGPPKVRLSLDEAQEIAEHVAQMSNARMPLAPGLRAAGDECDSSRLKKVLYFMANELDQGKALEDIIESSKGIMPGYVSSLIRAANQTSQLGPALAELVENYRNLRGIRRNLWKGLAYPFVVAVLALVILFFIVMFVAGGFEQILVEFDAELPLITELFFQWRRIGFLLVPGVLVALIAAVILIRWRLGKAGWQSWMACTPVIGPLWHWTALLEWIGLLRVLILYRIPLHDALRLSANGISNLNIGQLSQSIAEGVARGRKLSQMIATQHQIPASFVPIIRWGEEVNGLAESLGMGRAMLEERVRMRSLWLRVALPPILFIAIGCCLLLVVGGGMLLPLISIVSKLSG